VVKEMVNKILSAIGRAAPYVCLMLLGYLIVTGVMASGVCFSLVVMI
jgi:hypothetical protein